MVGEVYPQINELDKQPTNWESDFDKLLEEWKGRYFKAYTNPRITKEEYLMKYPELE